MKSVTSKMMLAALGTLMLTACNNEEVMPGGETWSDTPQFSATIEGAGEVATRATDQLWNVNDKIGISGTSGDMTYTNLPYKVAGEGISGKFSPVAETIYYQTDEAVTFTAYYPWNEKITAEKVTIAADTWRQADQRDFDFLWAQANGEKAKPQVNFRFAHKMSKLELTVKKGDGVNFDEVKKAVLMLEKFKHEGTFNVTDGTTVATGNESGMWEFANNSDDEVFNAPFQTDNTNQTVTYTLLFFPQEFSMALPFTATLTDEQSFKADLDFKAANATLDGAAAKNEWVAGRQYSLGIVLNKTGITVEGCTIAPWEKVPGGDFSAE